MQHVSVRTTNQHQGRLEQQQLQRPEGVLGEHVLAELQGQQNSITSSSATNILRQIYLTRRLAQQLQSVHVQHPQSARSTGTGAGSLSSADR